MISFNQKQLLKEHITPLASVMQSFGMQAVYEMTLTSPTLNIMFINYI
jgi:hypothetical protein